MIPLGEQFIHTFRHLLFLAVVELVAHAVFDVVVDDEVLFLFREAAMLRRPFVDLVDDGF